MTTTWRGGPNGGIWLDAANWTAGLPPITGAAALINGAFGTISLAASGGHVAHAGQVTIQSATLAFAGGTLNLDPSGIPANGRTNLVVGDSTLTVAADALVIATGAVSFAADAIVHIAGRLEDASAVVHGPGDRIDVSGGQAVWRSSVSLYVGGVAGSAGSLTVAQGGTLRVVQVATIADGILTVTGAGSSANVGTLEVGNGLDSNMLIANGAKVTTFETIIGDAAQANVVLTGAGSSLSTQNGLSVGSANTNASLTVTDGASLHFGNGMSVDGVLRLDATAKLDTRDYIFISGGTVIAQPPSGAPAGPDVVLGNAFYLFAFGGGTSIGYVESLPGSRLVLNGVVSESAVSPEALQVAGGTVVLSNPNNDITKVQIGPGILEVAASGAAGHHAVAFLSGSGTVLVDAGVTLSETVSGFYHSDQFIDLAGLAASTSQFSYVAMGSGGTLTVGDGTHSLALTLAGYHSATGFMLGSDFLGHAMVSYQGPTHP